MKTFSNSGYKIIYLKASPYEFNQSHSENVEKNNQELHHESQCRRFPGSLPKQQEIIAW